jgi:hypothetical protein
MAIETQEQRAPLLFIDSCAWWHWHRYRYRYRYRAGHTIDADLAAECEAFENIYQMAASGLITLLRNARVRHEVGQIAGLFEDLIEPLAVQVPIPLTRFDGLDVFDGSTLMGGRTGGSLSPVLELSGRRNEQALRAAADALRPDEFLFDTKLRRKEFDVEHMESALEACADLFVTTDKKSILGPLDRHHQEFNEADAIRLIHAIAVTPRDALTRLSDRQVFRNV